MLKLLKTEKIEIGVVNINPFVFMYMSRMIQAESKKGLTKRKENQFPISFSSKSN